MFIEGNNLAYFLANHVFFFAGSQRLIFSSFQDLPKDAKVILNMEKTQIPNLRIKKLQNRNYNSQG